MQIQLNQWVDKSMFKASWSFYACQIAGILLFTLTFSLLWLLFGDTRLTGFTVTANSIWLVGFFFAGLVMRHRYHQYRQQGDTLVMQILKCILVMMVVALIIVVVMSLLCLPFYFSEVLAVKRLEDPDINGLELIWKFVFGNWIQTNVYLAAWSALYMGITGSRRAKRAELDNLRLQNSLKEAKLSSLSNQLNPHFLFNALNNIRFMILEDATHAERMLMSLSEVLRYSLESSKQETLPLKQEISIIERYLDIVRIQFEDRLRFSINIDASLHTQLVPPMILQMLVENSIKHGLEQMQHGGAIDVSAYHDEASFTMQVSNNMPDSKSSALTNTGIGLQNIRQRLQLLYGDSASLKTAVIDDRFRVSIIIPRDKVA